MLGVGFVFLQLIGVGFILVVVNASPDDAYEPSEVELGFGLGSGVLVMLVTVLSLLDVRRSNRREAEIAAWDPRVQRLSLPGGVTVESGDVVEFQVVGVAATGEVQGHAIVRDSGGNLRRHLIASEWNQKPVIADAVAGFGGAMKIPVVAYRIGDSLAQSRRRVRRSVADHARGVECRLDDSLQTVDVWRMGRVFLVQIRREDCARCGYSLVGLTDPSRCPECGEVVSPSR